MLNPGNLDPVGFGFFSIFAVIGGLTLLVGADHAAPGCTGPAVKRCDYVATAKAAMVASGSEHALHHPFDGGRDFVVFEQGSLVLVQQSAPSGPGFLNHASAVRIDKKSCRPCEIGYAQSAPWTPDQPQRGSLILQVPAEDPVEGAKWAEYVRMMQAEIDDYLTTTGRGTPSSRTL
ncbi:hypothetical protein D3C85_1306310 [compost metagenome]